MFQKKKKTRCRAPSAGDKLGLASPPQLAPKKKPKSPLQGQRKMNSTEILLNGSPIWFFIVTADTMLKPNV